MSSSLRDIEVLVVDCQASGATPAYGDVLELAWTVCSAAGDAREATTRWVIPRTERRVSRVVRELTGWDEACLEEAVPEREVWAELASVVARQRERWRYEGVPSVIHFARFELAFLNDLEARLGEGVLPLDVRCVHAIAARLFPALPRRSMRALAGYLGHPAALIRRAAGHVDATAFIWRALVPQLEAAGVSTWEELGGFLEAKAPSTREVRREFPLPSERRRSLPDSPGVYRFLRKSGDVLYVGKATSLKKRVAGHYTRGRDKTERALELLTQVSDIAVTPTDSVLEAALLECDEIKRLDPPYNVQLRAHERHAWFASRELSDASPAPAPEHRIGPLPSRGAVAPLYALCALADGAEGSPRLRALSLSVPTAWVPDAALFDEGFRAFTSELERLAGPIAGSEQRVRRASVALWLERGRAEPESAPEQTEPDTWDLARVQRRLSRALIQGGLLLRRARFLCLLADADVAFRERGMVSARALTLQNAEVVARLDLESVADLARLEPRRMSARLVRQASFDAARYDRMRVLTTELARIQSEGGEVALRFGARTFAGERLERLMRVL